MICKICFSLQTKFDINYKHVCTPSTCSNCFSPKFIENCLCRKCLQNVACFFCNRPTVYYYQGINVCPEHLDKSLLLEADMRKQDFEEFREDYETQMFLQKKRREAHHRRLFKKREIFSVFAQRTKNE